MAIVDSVQSQAIDPTCVDSSILESWSYKYLKRLFDLLISAPGLVFIAPMMLLIAITIKVTSPGPIFYRWRIMNRKRQCFTSFKFRTMVVNAEKIEIELRCKGQNEMDGVYFKLKEDPRVTPIGCFLRKFSLDELPTIWSVVTGQLSLVGPRPIRECEYEDLSNWHMARFLVKPGLTGLWQVSGKNKIYCFDDIVNIDLDYIRKWSLGLDINIIFKTFSCVLSGSNY